MPAAFHAKAMLSILPSLTVRDGELWGIVELKI